MEKTLGGRKSEQLFVTKEKELSMVGGYGAFTPGVA
jgi:hypothetical protein